MSDPDRIFSPESNQRTLARRLYQAICHLPLICPHGHVDPVLLADENASFGTPTDLLIIPDHYVTRMLYSQGIALDALGVPSLDGSPVERDHRRIWQIFAEHFHLLRGTPTGLWLREELESVFGIKEKPSKDSAQSIYDQIEAKLATPEFRPRALFERFNIEVLCTTDAASDALVHHQAIRGSGWHGDVRPTFRPDAVINLETPGWKAQNEALSAISGVDILSYRRFIEALENRRQFFREMGACASDHAASTAYTEELPPAQAESIFLRALRGESTVKDARRFTAHMLMECARMSIDDGLVMQLHVGAERNHNPLIYARFGADRGTDIPRPSEFTQNLRPLLNKYGNDPRLTLVLFTLDESTYARELAPLAGHYPALKLGPPWWFHDSPSGMKRYFEQVMETAGLYNSAGFNDDTRAFPSIPARHDLWRRQSADWVAGLLLRGIIDEQDAQEMMIDLAYGLAKRTYRFGG